MEFEKHLLVDGYNIIHAWPSLKRVLQGEGSGPARERLVEAVRILHDLEKNRVSLVFDGRGDSIEIERPFQEQTFSCLFSPRGMTADDLIERLVGSSGRPETIAVATSDSEERLTVESLGARAISPEDLADWVSRAEREQQSRLKERRRSVDRDWKKKEQGGGDEK